MNDNSNPITDGALKNNGGTPDPIQELRERHADAVSGRKETRGVKPGASRGSYKKGPVGAGSAAPSGPAAPAAVVPANNEGVQKKMGQVWRTVGYGLALGTNCNVWILDPEQEKLLGEAYGDLCSAFGIADTLAFKIVFCVGTTIGIMGTKAFSYATYKADLARKEEQLNKNLKDSGKPKEKPAPGPDAPPTPPTEVHETKPGVL